VQKFHVTLFSAAKQKMQRMKSFNDSFKKSRECEEEKVGGNEKKSEKLFNCILISPRLKQKLHDFKIVGNLRCVDVVGGQVESSKDDTLHYVILDELQRAIQMRKHDPVEDLRDVRVLGDSRSAGSRNDTSQHSPTNQAASTFTNATVQSRCIFARAERRKWKIVLIADISRSCFDSTLHQLFCRLTLRNEKKSQIFVGEKSRILITALDDHPRTLQSRLLTIFSFDVSTGMTVKLNSTSSSCYRQIFELQNAKFSIYGMKNLK
jgi:hypothetical protein